MIRIGRSQALLVAVCLLLGAGTPSAQEKKSYTLDKINKWNKEKRFARAYKDDEGDPVLEMDVDLDFAGIPRENVGETFNTWASLMDSFREYVFEK